MRALIGVVLVSVLGACSSPPADPGGGALSRVEGVVYRPAEGAVVDLYRKGDDLRGPPFTQLGPLDARGGFGIELPPGEYVLVARQRASGDETGPLKEGDLKTDPVPLRVEAGKPVRLDLMAYVKEGNPKQSLPSETDWKSGIAGRVL